MREWIKKHSKKFVAALLIVVPLAMAVSSSGATVGESTTGPTRAAAGATTALKSGIHGVVGTVGNLVGRLGSDPELEEENEELRDEVARLQEEKTRLIGVLQENARLREMVGFQQDHPEFDLVPARVVGRDISPYFRVLKLRIESDADLEERMPVVAPEGVVGQIHRVYHGGADVVIAADTRSRIDAVGQRNRAPGIVVGLGEDSNYRARVAYVSQRDELQKGDTMVTSGMGGVFPRELRIGTLVEVDSPEDQLFQEVIVEPAVDFSRLQEVFIITDVK